MSLPIGLSSVKKSNSIITNIALIVILFIISRYNYLLFHTMAEGFAIIVAALIYVLAIKTYKHSNNNYLLFLGIAYFYVAVIDFLHLITYKGMGIFPGFDANPPTQLWIAARFMEAVSLISALFIINRKFSCFVVKAIYAVITLIILSSIFWYRVFPACFVEGQGLTYFKIVSEYIISAILLAGLYLLFTKKQEFQTGIYKNVVASIVATIISELSFTLFTDIYGVMNFTGHIFKIISFVLIYLGIVKAGIEDPYNLIFKELKLASGFIRHLWCLKPLPS
jgi:hypothetical protein